jgi:hypothetical protein
VPPSYYKLIDLYSYFYKMQCNIRGQVLQKIIDDLSPPPYVNSCGVSYYNWDRGQYGACLLEDEIYTIKIVDNKKNEYGMQLYSTILIKNDDVFKKWCSLNNYYDGDWVCWKATRYPKVFEEFITQLSLSLVTKQ